jgi:hypothetical protein
VSRRAYRRHIRYQASVGVVHFEVLAWSDELPPERAVVPAWRSQHGHGIRWHRLTSAKLPREPALPNRPVGMLR